MKTMHVNFTHRFRWALVMLFVSQQLVSCTTLDTTRLVKMLPMNDDLEKKVMRQTGISGAVLGAAAGIGVGILLSALVGAAGGQPSSVQQAQMAQITGAAVVAGGIFGWQKGQQQGKKIVASAKERDQFAQLVKGARDYNARTAEHIANLRKQIAAAKKTKDSQKIAALNKDERSLLKSVDSRLGDRGKMAESINPENRSIYLKTLPELKRQRTELYEMLRRSEPPVSAPIP